VRRGIEQATVTVRPSGVERRLAAEDVIVSKTDLQGRITYVNDVFCDISKWTEADAIGRPHNIIRHPEMPRSVFALLWSEIAAGREIFAYVDNLARDGAHYWVFAHVTPTRANGRIVGYHSNRRAPHPDAVTAIAPVYRALLAEERRHAHGPDAIAAGAAMLNAVLADQGVTYDEFVWSLAPNDHAHAGAAR
jgi:PAS domain S-box-containing protein